MKIKCITVDDEPLALNMINSFVQQTPFLELENTFDNSIDALGYIQSHAVQLIFLDIQMADFTGMELARVISSSIKEKPFIIFTTAYSEFALEGYRVDAVDYILKPFDYEDFIKAVTRVRSRFNQHIETVATKVPEPAQEYIFIKVDSQIVRVEIKDILYIEGFKNYIRIFLTGSPQPLLSLMSLKKLEEKLNKTDFFRIHRSFIVSFAKVDALLKGCVRIGDKLIPVGATSKDEYDRFVDKWVK
ncbi:MAG TPA: LytTR family DNA-binding domain-containing protein [Niabella sp.]|nr:LytTR family DNA-binding domain-containing protein [Niabella sp.]HOZ97650.1 LytTR family DNA-binding domain-containing protein [Niabella sp.]HQW13956.1 LytTR family DNA-binding domain-containing protein [Niabella sp.]HQX19501.1 LytTR family DNA-binding domain-containing protein [Niabella sp.]HQX41462.1 LytTR family DNA-binding domain-containing protein [Niabella sp.]